jgi:sigma-B regulation protein RsbU (phosphoserine phosphatase)
MGKRSSLTGSSQYDRIQKPGTLANNTNAVLQSQAFVSKLAFSMERKNSTENPLGIKMPDGIVETPHAILQNAINAHTIIATTDARGVIIDANERFCKVSGYSREELIGQDHRIVRSGYHPNSFFKAMWERITAGEIWKGRICNRAKSGKLYWVESTIFPLMGADNVPCGYLALRTDVSELVAEKERSGLLAATLDKEKLHAETLEQQMVAIFNYGPIGISWREMDADGVPGKNHVNKRFTEIIGLTEEEALNIENVRRCTHPDDWEQQQELTRALYAGEMDRFSFEKRYIHPNGKMVWGELTVTLLRNAAGKATHHFAMLEDITSRHVAEENLRQSESRWRTYLETASEILYALTPDLNYKFVSPAWTDKLGHPTDQVLGRSFFDFIHRDDVEACRDFIAAVLEGKPHVDYIEYRTQHHDGHWLWHATTGSAYSDRDKKTAFFGVARDINLRKQTEFQLKAALRQREELERIVNRSPAIIVLWRSENGAWPVEFVSHSIRQYGYEPEQFTSRELAFIDITHPDDRERVRMEMDAHELGQHNEYNQEYRIVTANGETRYVEDHTIVRRDERGRISHHEGMITDVTERKLAEDKSKAALAKELQVAREVQMHLLPTEFPVMQGLEADALVQSSLVLGGDYFDIIKVDRNHIGFAIADVSGKGTPAALMMSACRSSLRILARGELSPVKTLAKLNESLQDDMPPQMFITLFYGVYNIKTRELRYSRCGHEPPMIIRAGDIQPKFLSEGGFALGMVDSDLFSDGIGEGRVTLERGDLLVLYTDGINEASSTTGEEFGIERMVDLFIRYEGRSLKDMIRRLDRHLRQFSALSQTLDDRTLLLIRAID